ncbi:phage portal protein [Rhodovulum sp. MB263]|uniref:phage portal protein n=2 Tax=unclassified Rhodovulum TaxID=2631432 RepID=UPI0009B75381|nr:phage portal protein [Rhodovulum sp. MB263]ARC87889.1 hypothetical protein B5V46_04285 [Rhodovulum sp. MB263]
MEGVTMWPFKRKEETRAASSFTAEVMRLRENWIAGASGVAELTATVQTCVSLWEQGLSLAEVKGTPLLDRFTLAMIGRSLALRGEVVLWLRGDRLVPASDWDLSTRDGRPRAYRLTIPEVGGGATFTALAGEVLHIRIGADAAQPWIGSAPLRRARLTAGLLQAVETALSETYENAPIGTQIVPLPDSDSDDMAAMRAAFRGRRGSVLVVEGVAQATAAGQHPQIGQHPDDLTPDLSKAMTKETLDAARNAVSGAFGVLPGLLNPATTGPMVREAQRHLAQWMLQPIAALIAEEASEKLGTAVTLDVMTPLQAFDAGGRARAMSAIIGAMVQAKEAGIDPAQALKLVDWNE